MENMENKHRLANILYEFDELFLKFAEKNEITNGEAVYIFHANFIERLITLNFNEEILDKLLNKIKINVIKNIEENIKTH